ncbi:GntR family transcriptional regulator [Nesterenkonia alkaliphila]|uniref:GntR family transcriptional regulator n=1 Tax=Nesterenkonia alkaliphila TaxID=1463631 RepID=A0A7K1UFZ9_9MICC|nr:GntR family transcriptional regulator [Nesterenkonia alkaliphila]MVT25390.1 GntR family transcriptional regulator [Nesterenkonia alkaliphila]GFZ83427.1 GntR family transcriptional regulator [Nesterenkonia alkaliphila]
MSPQSQYTRIRADLERAIRSGELPPGSKLPTERELCQTYNVSRATVQRAVTAMAEAGLVTRRRRAGTVVTHRATDLLGFTNLLATGPETEGAHRVISAQTLPAADLDFDLPGVGEQDAVHRLTRVKEDRHGSPVVIEVHAVPFAVAPRLMSEDLTQLTTLAYYQREGIPVVRSRLYINPGVAAAREAELLQLPQGTPLFFTRRESYLKGGGLAEVYNSVLAPHAFQLFVEQTIDPDTH